jgi:hypothetical protein
MTGSRPDGREPETVAIRSLLFLPADRPDLVPKLERYRPDAAVLDLEDAVAEAGKAAARTMIADSAAAAARIGVLCLIRINPPQTPQFWADLDAAAASAAAGIVLPKYERAERSAIAWGRTGWLWWAWRASVASPTRGRCWPNR